MLGAKDFGDTAELNVCLEAIMSLEFSFQDPQPEQPPQPQLQRQEESSVLDLAWFQFQSPEGWIPSMSLTFRSNMLITCLQTAGGAEHSGYASPNQAGI